MSAVTTKPLCVVIRCVYGVSLIQIGWYKVLPFEKLDTSGVIVVCVVALSKFIFIFSVCDSVFFVTTRNIIC